MTERRAPHDLSGRSLPRQRAVGDGTWLALLGLLEVVPLMLLIEIEAPAAGELVQGPVEKLHVPEEAVRVIPPLPRALGPAAVRPDELPEWTRTVAWAAEREELLRPDDEREHQPATLWVDEVSLDLVLSRSTWGRIHASR